MLLNSFKILFIIVLGISLYLSLEGFLAIVGKLENRYRQRLDDNEERLKRNLDDFMKDANSSNDNIEMITEEFMRRNIQLRKTYTLICGRLPNVILIILAIFNFGVMSIAFTYFWS